MENQKNEITADLSFEESMHKLQEIVNQLEKGEVPLAKALDIYSQGVDLYKKCSEQLNSAKITIRKIAEQKNSENS